MRLTLLVLAFLLIGTSLPADDGSPAPDTTGLTKQEIKEGFVSLFDGKTAKHWQGAIKGYVPENGLLVCKKKGGGRLNSIREYSDFIFRFEFKLTPGGNNGVAIRSPLGGRPSRNGIEIQILDDSSPRYTKLKPYQYHGSIYGLVPAKRGHLKPVGQWNSQEIACDGRKIKITLNGTVIVDADLTKVDGSNWDGTGWRRDRGYIGFIGHGERIELRNIRIKEL